MPQKTITMIPATIPKQSAQNRTIGHKRRVAAYARVSTDSDEQFTSYEAQIDYYTKYIAERSDWALVKVYADEGISGTSTKHRDGFNLMIADALDGKIDLIITKSISRFARNTVDTLTTVRKLKDRGIEVFFEKENIYTLDSKGELLISIMSSIAQEESRSISENVTWGQRKRFQDGKVSLPYKRFLGYEKGEDGFPKVVESEARIVRRIYKDFLDGMSITKLAQTLTAEGIPTPSGKTKWSTSTLESILRNEKYKGDALLQKKFTVDFLTKKTKQNEGEVPQYYVSGSHEAIVSPEVFELVQYEFQRRKELLGKSYSAVGMFAGHIFCGECGGLYGSKIWHSNDKYRRRVWRCNSKYKNQQGYAACNTPHLTEDQIKTAFISAMNACIKNKSEIISACNEALDALCDQTEIEEEIARLNEECAVTAELISKCVEESAHAAIRPEIFEERYAVLADRYQTAKEKLTEYESRLHDRIAKRESTRQFLKQLTNKSLVTEFDKDLWNAVVDRVVVYSFDKVVFEFKDGTEVEQKIE